jgi:hypothetical protein
MTNDSGSEGGVFGSAGDDERPVELAPKSQKPLATRSEDYIETGYLAVGVAEDGGVRMGGEAPPGPAPGLTSENMVCLEAEGRPYCEHYIAFLTDAEGTAKGFAKMRQIRRYCRRMSTASELMEIGETAIYACTSRSPQDPNSMRLIRDHELRQRRAAEEMARESGEIDL